MKLDSAEYQNIEDLKSEEKKSEEEKLYKSIARLAGDESSTHSLRTSTQHPFLSNGYHTESCCTTSPTCDDTVTNDDADDHEDEESDIFSMDSLPLSKYPAVRGAARIRFKHTPRIFKTPVRESAILREKEFLVKNRPFLRYNKHFNTQCTDVSDADPMWLKRKGDDFYKKGDYMAAINAYTEALEKDKHHIQALTNRSACYLYIGEAQRCILDSEEALTLVKSDGDAITPTNLSSIALKLIHKKILIRIANAHCQVGGGLIHFERALDNLEQAQKLDTSDLQLAQDIERVKRILGATKTKVEADELLSNGMIDEAIDIYTEKVLTVEPTLVGAKVNCATAYMICGCYKECLVLCEQVLDVFRSIGPCKHGAVPPIGTIPLPGTQRRRNMVVACLYKRAEAFTKLSQYDEALVELKMMRNMSSAYGDMTETDQEIAKLKEVCKKAKTITQ